MTDIFFALDSNTHKTFTGWDFKTHPVNALVTFADPQVIRKAAPFPFQRRMLDSGAFSAWNTGKTIDMNALIVASKSPEFTETVCLDVIGDADASVKNALAMKAAGSPAFPVFHIGDPWEHLMLYKKEFGRTGLSCRFGEPTRSSIKWLEQCFARAWPCRFHSFGWIGGDALARFPFDTADATTWLMPRMYGEWRGFGTQSKRHFGFPAAEHTFKVRGGHWSLAAEVHAFLKVQRSLTERWRKELAQCRNP